MKPPHLPGAGRELRHMLTYSDDDKSKLFKLVIAFRKRQEKVFAKASDVDLSRMLRDYLAEHDFVGHTETGWYVVQSGNPDDPIKDVVKRTWLIVDRKYIIDTCADRWHKDEPDNYRIVISRIGAAKDYSPVKVSKSAAKFNAKVKSFFKKPFARKDPEEGISGI